MLSLTVVGHLGKDGEIRYAPSGQAVMNFNVASTRKFSVNGEKREETTWVRCTLWGKTAENISPYLTKGKLVCVEGHLVPDDKGGPRIYTRSDGTPGATFEMFVERIELLGGGGNVAQPEQNDTIDDIPF